MSEKNKKSLQELFLEQSIGTYPTLLIKQLFPETYRETEKLGAKMGTETIESALDLGATVVDSIVPEKVDPNRQERRQATQDILSEFYRHLYGEDVLTTQQRYGIETTVAEPLQSVPLDVAADMAQLVVGGGLAKKGIQKVLPKKRKPRPFTETLVATEVGSQFAFDPLEESLIEMVGGMIVPGNDEAIDDIKNYIEKGSEGDSRLKNRMLLLGEGLAGAGVFYGVGKGLTAVNRKVKMQERFVQLLDKVRGMSKESQESFIQRLENSSSANARQGRVALRNRRKEIKDGTVKDLGDFESLQPSKYTGSDLNLSFNKSSLIRLLETTRKKLFTTRGNKTLRMQENFLKSENVKEMYQDKIANIGYNLENIYQKIVKNTKNNEDLKNEINEVLFSDDRLFTVITSKKYRPGKSQREAFEAKLKTLPKELQQPVREARELQDKLSLLMLDTGYLTKKQKEIYLDSLGFYVRRSYKMFEDPNYIPDEGVVKNLKDYFRKTLNPEGTMNPDVLEERVEALVKDLSDISGRDNFVANLNNFEKVGTQILKGKKEIPKEIRAFLGEMDDPIEKFVHSTTKLSRLLQNAKFYDETFEDGIGIYFRREKEGIFRFQIPKGYGPLSGNYTSKELLQYFNNYKDLSQKFLESENIFGQAYRNLLFLKGTSQAAKTVWSHTTHVKNIAGGAHMSLANGINVFNPSQAKYVIQTLKARTSDNKALQDFHEELSELGLLNKGVIARDLKGLTDDISKVKTGKITSALTSPFRWMVDKEFLPYISLKEKGIRKTSVKKVLDKAQNAYIAEDDFFKINMYITEERNLTKINNMLPENLKKSAQEIKRDAANIVRDVLPNYDLVPEYFKAVRRFPLAGRFFSFMSESVRISAGAIKNIRNDFKKGQELINQGAREAGEAYERRAIKRLASFSVMAVGGGNILAETSQSISGLGKDAVEALKEFLPDYMKNSNILVSVADDGTPMVSNISSWDAYDYPKKPFNIILPKIFDTNVKDEDLLTEFYSSMVTEMVSPFLGESIIAEPIYDYFFADGRDKNNRPMKFTFMGNTYEYDTGGTTAENRIENLPILFGKLMEAVTPGTVDRLFDYTKTFGKDQTKYDQDIYQFDQFIKFTTGWGTSPMNKEYLENVFKFKTYDFNKSKRTRTGRLSNGLGDKLDHDRFTNNYIKETNKYYKEFSKMGNLIDASKKFNLDWDILTLDAGVISEDRSYFYSSKFNPLPVGETLQERMYDIDKDGVYNDVLNTINDLQIMYTNFPLLTDENDYKQQKETLEELRDELREEFFTGGPVLQSQFDFARNLGEAILSGDTELQKETNEFLAEREKQRDISEEEIKKSLAEKDYKAAFEAYETLPIGQQMLGYVFPPTGVPISAVGTAVYTERANPRFKTADEYVRGIVKPSVVPLGLRLNPVTVDDPLSAGIAGLEATGVVPVAGLTLKAGAAGLKRFRRPIKSTDDFDGEGGGTTQPPVNKEKEIYTTNSTNNSFSPVLKALLVDTPNQKGENLLNWLKKQDGIKKEELDLLKIEQYVAQNPKASAAEIAESIKDNKIKINLQIAKGEDAKRIEYDYEIAKEDPLTGQPAYIEYEFPDEASYLDNPFYQLTPRLEGYDAGRVYAHGNEDVGFEFFIDGQRVTRRAEEYVDDYDRVGDRVYSRTEAEIRLNSLMEDEGIIDTIDIDTGEAFIGEGFGGQTQYRYVIDENLPGGKNYQEIVFLAKGDSPEFNTITDEMFDRHPDGFHFTGRPNNTQFAHALVRDRIIGVENLKSLHIDELQSDIHKLGKRYGYLTDFDMSKMRRLEEIARQGTDDILLIGEYNVLIDKVADLPYKNNWQEVSLNQLLYKAAREGYDSLSISTSDILVDRYTSRYKDFYEGLYDKRYKTHMEKLANKYKGQFIQSQYDLPDINFRYNEYLDKRARNVPLSSTGAEFMRRVEDKGLFEVNAIIISDEMRDLILKEGLPSFAEGGIVRQSYFEGEKVSEDFPVTDVAEEPANRVDPFTGAPYKAQMEELGL